MKMNKILIAAILSTGFISCSESSSKEEPGVKNSHVDSTVVESVIEKTEEIEVVEEVDEVVESRYQYDKDWERFKEAVVAKDIRGVSAFASSDAIDAEILIDAFSDPEFLEMLKVATYEDLETNTDGPEVLLVFSAAVSGSDEEGNEYESGLYLYFSQGEQSLMLENFLAAG